MPAFRSLLRTMIHLGVLSMNKDIRQAMRLGIVQFMAYPFSSSGNGPILESVDELAADGYFDVLEMTHINDPAIRKEVRTHAHTAGMQIAYGSQPQVLGQKLNLNSRNPEERKKTLQIILEKVDIAVEMGAVAFAAMSGPDPGETFRAEEFKLFADSLFQICEKSKNLNPEMDVVIESFDRCAFGKNCLVGPTVEAAAFVKEIQKTYPKFGLMIDLSHLPMLGEGPEEGVTAALPVLRHAHFGNTVIKDPKNPYYGDNHPPFAYQDSENELNELVRYFSALDKAGFLNVDNPPIVSSEIKPLNEGLIKACIGNVKRNVNRAIAIVNRMST